MRRRAKLHPSIRITSRVSGAALSLALFSRAALADPQRETGTASPPPPASKAVGGHVGVALPLVTVSKDTTSVSDQFTLLVPIGIGFRVSQHVAVDFETIVGTPIHPTGKTSLVVDPGVLFPFGRVTAGLRLAFRIDTQANVGLVPLVNYALVDLGAATWFVEAAFPTFYSDHEVALTAVIHTGVGF